MPRVPFSPDRELEELRSYLGDEYDPSLAPRFLDLVDEELERVGDEAELYRTSRAYLYNLTLFAISGTKLPYLRTLRSLVPPPARLLDYGCGIGSDGMALIEAGYEVAFADFDNPSVEYLRWRLRQRGLEASIYDIERDEIPTGFDAAYAFDVIEHVTEPVAFLRRLESVADLVCVNLLESSPEETVLHHELPIEGLLERAARAGIRRYRRMHHGASHLVLYKGDKPGTRARPGSRLRLWAGHLISPLSGLLGRDRPGRQESAAIATVRALLAQEAGLKPAAGRGSATG